MLKNEINNNVDTFFADDFVRCFKIIFTFFICNYTFLFNQKTDVGDLDTYLGTTFQLAGEELSLQSARHCQTNAYAILHMLALVWMCCVYHIS